MRDAKTILGIIRARGRQGLPLEDVYRQLYNPELYLLAYAKIAQNKGAMTPGVTAETADGMSLEKVQTLIETLRCERYRWRPVRRLYIEKKNSVKKRPLGIPTWSNKVLQEVMRLILEAYYEPQFSDHSVGFDLDSAATMPSRESTTRGEGRSGLSKETFPRSLTNWTIRSFWQYYERRFMITDLFG
jgi:hypothetical protein